MVELNNKIAILAKQINQCEGSMTEFNAAVTEYIALAKRYETSLTTWRQISKTYMDWITSRDTFILSNITLPSYMIWDGVLKVDCRTLKSIDYLGAFGESWGMKNCNDVPGTAQSKCTACGFVKCGCTSGLTTWCDTGKCKSYQTIDRGIFMTTPYYRSWLQSNPEPPSPGPSPQPPPAFSPAVNMVCTTCNQNVTLANITSSSGAVQFHAGAIQQAQTCIASLSQQKADLERQRDNPTPLPPATTPTQSHGNPTPLPPATTPTQSHGNLWLFIVFIMFIVLAVVLKKIVPVIFMSTGI